MLGVFVSGVDSTDVSICREVLLSSEDDVSVCVCSLCVVMRGKLDCEGGGLCARKGAKRREDGMCNYLLR